MIYLYISRLYSGYLYFAKKDEPSPEEFHEAVKKHIENYKNCTIWRTEQECAYQQYKTSKSEDFVINNNARFNLGLYVVFITDWLRMFPKHQLHIINMEEYSANKYKVMNDIFRFLELKPLYGINESTQMSEQTLGDMQPATRVANKYKVLNSIFKFLELKPFNSIEESTQMNERTPEHKALGDMQPATRKLLRKFYAPFNRRLSELLNDNRFLWGYS